MRMLAEFGRFAPNRIFAGMALGVISGLGYAMLIPVLLAAIADDPAGLLLVGEKTVSLFSIEIANPHFAALFFGLCLLIVISRSSAKIVMSRTARDMTVALRTRLARRIAAAPLTVLESIGPARLAAILTEDVRRIVVGGQMLPDMLTNCITVLGTLVFIGYFNYEVLLMVVQAIVVGALAYQLPMKAGRRLFEQARHQYDELQEAVRALLYGSKELKLDRLKRANFFAQVLAPRERALAGAETRAQTLTIAVLSLGDMVSFVVIGLLAFVFVNYHVLGGAELLSVVMAVLYLSGPMASLMNAIVPLALANVSLRNVERVLGDIDVEPEPVQGTDAATPAWDSIHLRDLQYVYGGRGDRFAVGPLDLDIHKGKITFIVGGNGAGKSTLAKLIALHYQPSGGSICFDATPVSDDTREQFRQSIATVFTDYYLFDRLLGNINAGTLETARSYLHELGLAGKVTIDNGLFSSVALSDGQRKRLALLVALLDDKDLYIFDEWAADQDPLFKEVFYRKLLPNLKARGKAVLVISHDDRYFDIADAKLVLADGRLRGQATQAAVLAPDALAII